MFIQVNSLKGIFDLQSQIKHSISSFFNIPSFSDSKINCFGSSTSTLSRTKISIPAGVTSERSNLMTKILSVSTRIDHSLFNTFKIPFPRQINLVVLYVSIPSICLDLLFVSYFTVSKNLVGLLDIFLYVIIGFFRFFDAHIGKSVPLIIQLPSSNESDSTILHHSFQTFSPIESTLTLRQNSIFFY
ncbi:hypothetical protein C240_828 [Enterococcus sp. 5H]|nr:hypothetical protein [Enterococcus sp. 5H]